MSPMRTSACHRNPPCFGLPRSYPATDLCQYYPGHRGRSHTSPTGQQVNSCGDQPCTRWRLGLVDTMGANLPCPGQTQDTAWGPAGRRPDVFTAIAANAAANVATSSRASRRVARLQETGLVVWSRELKANAPIIS
jgi:hypothetical protein